MTVKTHEETSGIGPVVAGAQAGGIDASGLGTGTYPEDMEPEERDVSWPSTIPDVEKALEWAGEAQMEAGEIRRQVEAVKAEVERRGVAIIAKAENRASRLLDRVMFWAEGHRDDVVRGKNKTRELLGGSIAFRSKAERLVVIDEEALSSWLASQPDASLYRVKVEPDMKALQARFKSTGEIPAGMDFEAATETITVTAHPLPQLKE